jgi:rhamnosyl/mannosyltransferase
VKILQINKHTWPHYGGIERIVEDIGKGLAASAQVDVLCINESGSRTVQTRQHSTIHLAESGWKFLSMPISFDFFKLSKKIIPQYDWLILHHPFPLGFLVYLLYGRKTKTAVWYHSDIVRQKFTGWLIRPLLRAVLNKADKIVVSDLSIATSSSLLKSFLEKVVVIPFALDLSQYSEDVAEKGKQLRDKFNNPLVLAVGRLVYYKGYEYLIKAMAGLGANLVVIGTGPLREQLIELIERLGLTNVIIMDPVEDLLPYYFAADVFVLPSVASSEAFGLVQLEAMAAGTPVINTWLPTAVKTVSLHEQTGLTVNPMDSVALKEALVKLLNDPSLRDQYGRQARQRIEQHYNLDKFSRSLIEILN